MRLNLAIERQGQGDLCEFKASLYRMSFWDSQNCYTEKPYLEKQRKQNKNLGNLQHA